MGHRHDRGQQRYPLTFFRSSSVDTFMPASSKSILLLLMTSSMMDWYTGPCAAQRRDVSKKGRDWEKLVGTDDQSV